MIIEKDTPVEDGMGNSSHLLKNRVIRVCDSYLFLLHLYVKNIVEGKTPYYLSLLLKVKENNAEDVLFKALRENPAENLTSDFLDIPQFNFQIEHRGNSISRAYFSRLMRNKMRRSISFEEFLEDNSKELKKNIIFSENYTDGDKKEYSIRDYENIPENIWLFNVKDRNPNKKKTYGRIIY